MSEPPCQRHSFDFRIIKEEEGKNEVGCQIDFPAAFVYAFLSQQIYCCAPASHKLISKLTVNCENLEEKFFYICK